MINEVVYCRRLFVLEHVDREWADSADTKRGSRVHKRVDRPDSRPDPGADAPEVRRSLTLSDDNLGVVARCDLVEIDGPRAVPIDYKKGRVPEGGPWLPERVQVCVQALLLRAHGYTVDEAILYFAGSKTRVSVAIDAALVTTTMNAIEEAHRLLESEALPEPLVESPKCPRCSLVGICLPDETNLLKGASDTVRPIAPGLADGLSLYVEARGAKLGLRGGEILVKTPDEPDQRVRISDTSSVVVRGAASITTPLLQKLMERGVPVSLQTFGGRGFGWVRAEHSHNVHGRIAQFRVSSDPIKALPIIRQMVQAKVSNSRVLLRRNGRSVSDALRGMKACAEQASKAVDSQQLLGIEGNAARWYFGSFATMIRDSDMAAAFSTNGRDRRPPPDPVNALLSFAYGNLARECREALFRVGLDPMVGLLHQPRAGKPALALDLMEEFRPVFAESAVLRALNGNILDAKHFVVRRTGTALTDAGRRRFIRVLEQRWREEAVHPVFGRRMAYRRIVEVQARLLSKALRGEIPYAPLRIR